MSSEKLVLWRTRRQRLADHLINPTAWVPIGPGMRFLMGDAYTPIFGIGMTFVVLLLTVKLTSWWAQRAGSEWITISERTRRLIDEARTTSAWPEMLAVPAMLVLLMLGFLLVLEPLDELGSSVGLDAGMFYLPAAAALLGAASVILGRRRLRQSVVIDERPPENLYKSQMRRLVPRMFLANLAGLTAGIAIALQFEGEQRFWIYAFAMIVVSGGLTHLILDRMALRRIYSTPATLKFSSHLWQGLLTLGMPGMFFFGGMMFFETMSKPYTYKVLMFGIMLFAPLLVGLGCGALIYFIRRIADPER